MKETINNVKIDKIERVQNLRLWNHYAFCRRTLQRELNNTSNLQIEMELFHGTGTTLPSEIYNGQYGFDMTFSTKGLWGIGTYFAANASYSCLGYSYQLPEGKRQVFLAQVLTGEVYECKAKTDPTLRRPPKKNEIESCARYNSVAGETGGSKVYIVYENRVTYPAFLITFSQ
jgi:poly [ADP-ribose] polymerase 10/14/15